MFDEQAPAEHRLLDRRGFDDLAVRTSVFSDVVRSRYAARDFTDRAVEREVIEAALLDASCAPSNCNTQPWRANIVSGRTRDRLSEALLRERSAGIASPDFPFATGDYPSEFTPRISDNGRRIYEPQGVRREDREARSRAALNNLRFYGAPHVAIVQTWEVGSLVHVAEDVGMFAQTFMLALAARGVASIPQTSVAQHADSIREVLELPPSAKILLAISFGYATEEADVNNVRSPRLVPEQVASFYD